MKDIVALLNKNWLVYIVKLIVPVLITGTGYIIKTELTKLNDRLESIEKSITKTNERTISYIDIRLNQHNEAEQLNNNIIFSQLNKLNNKQTITGLNEIKDILNSRFTASQPSNLSQSITEPAVKPHSKPVLGEIKITRKEDE